GLPHDVSDTRCRKIRCVRIHRAVPQSEDAAEGRQARSEVISSFTTVRDFGVEPDWLFGEDDYQEDSPWMYLIGDIKRFLLWYPESTETLRAAMVGEDLRLPIPDYSVVVRESSHVERALRMMRWGKYREGVQELKIGELVTRVKELRVSMDRELMQTFDQLDNSS